MKKTIRFLTVALAAVLVVLTFPMSAFAKTLMAPTLSFDTESDVYVVDPANTLLLDIDNLADTTNAVSGEVTYTTENPQTYGGLSLADDYIHCANGKTGWQEWIGHTTGLTYTMDSSYTITFRGQICGSKNGNYWIGGFAFAAPGGSDSTTYIISFSEGENQKWYNGNGTTAAYVSVDGQWAEDKCNAGEQATIHSFSDIDIYAEHDYMITVQGLSVGFYIDGALIGIMPLPNNWVGLNSSIALGFQARASVAADGDLAKMSDIKVYQGGVVSQKLNTLLLDIDNLADTTNAAAGDVTYTTENAQTYGGLAPVGDYIHCASGKTGWQEWIGHTTNLTLTTESVYTITFRGQVCGSKNGNYWIGGFAFAAPTGNDSTTYVISFSQGENSKWYNGGGPTAVYLSVDGQWAEDVYNANPANIYSVGDLDIYAEHDYAITISGLQVGLYIDNVFIGYFTLPNNWVALNSSIALGFQARASVAANGDLAKMSNIKVYSGLPQYAPNPNFKDTDVLLRVPNVIDATGWSSDFEDATVTQVEDGFQNATKGELADALYPIDHYDGPSEDLYKGVTTSIPLNENSKYTIEFYMKKYQAANVGFCVTASTWRYSQGVYFYNNSFTTIAQYSSNYYSDPVEFSGIWTNYADKDGYTRFTIEIDGYQWKVYIGGVEAGTFNINTNGKNNESYYTNTLGFALKVKSDEIDTWDLTAPIVSLKNIVVYAGNVATSKNVQFVQNGVELGREYADIGDVINAFPEIAVGEHQTAVWFNKNTNVVVKAPYTVYNDATLEARVFSNDASSVEGVQVSAIVENTQKVRFISVINSLEGSEAGFEVYAKYMNESVLTTVNWDPIKTTSVYSTINATEDGTIRTVTAAELGGTYLIALAVEDVPTDVGQIDFYVRSYVTLNGEKAYSEEKIISINDGVVDVSLAPLS